MSRNESQLCFNCGMKIKNGDYVEDVEVSDYENDDVEKVLSKEENNTKSENVKKEEDVIENKLVHLEDINFTSEDVEPEVEKIRELYYITQEEQDSLIQKDANGITYYTYDEQIIKIEIKGGYDNWTYSRFYYYFNNQLYFAFVFNGTEEHRFYYKNEELIRYIDSSKIVYDYGTESFQNIIEIDDVILEEAKTLLTEWKIREC